MSEYKSKLKRNTRLIDGRIPPNTVCPFWDKCEIAQCGKCMHKGIEHSVAFSCAVARGFDIVEAYSE